MNILINLLIRLVLWLGINLVIFVINATPAMTRATLRTATYGFGAFCRFCIAPWVTPRDHRRIGDYRSAAGYKELREERYAIRARWSMKAVAAINSR